MIKYITENDKNGKARFYKVIDGKKKVVSRAEYEAHTNVVETDNANVTDTAIVEVSFDNPLRRAETITNRENRSSEKKDATTATTATTDINSELQSTIGEVAFISDDSESNDQSETVVFNVDSEIGSVLAGVVNSILCASSKKPKAQISKTKKYIVVNYQKCMVLSLAVSESGMITAIRFKGTEKWNRKEVRSFPFNKSVDISDFKDEIAKQIEFIDSKHSTKKRACDKKTA